MESDVRVACTLQGPNSDTRFCCSQSWCSKIYAQTELQRRLHFHCSRRRISLLHHHRTTPSKPSQSPLFAFLLSTSQLQPNSIPHHASFRRRRTQRWRPSSLSPIRTRTPIASPPATAAAARHDHHRSASSPGSTATCTSRPVPRSLRPDGLNRRVCLPPRLPSISPLTFPQGRRCWQ